MTTIPRTLPAGRIPEAQAHPDARLYALKRPRALFGEYQTKRYASRKALETFLRNPGEWFALVRDPVLPQMMIFPAFQYAQEP